VEEFGLTLQGEEILTPWLENEAKGIAEVQGSDIAESLGGLASAVDTAALTGDFADFMAATFRKSVSTGVAGWCDDDLAFVQPWGFHLDAIKVPVSLWQGREDRMVPFDHGAWLAKHIPGAHAHLLTSEGHLSLRLTRFDDTLEELVELAR
jgi:pimeloyl-ACP methyl ester carboxylesterase